MARMTTPRSVDVRAENRERIGVARVGERVEGAPSGRARRLHAPVSSPGGRRRRRGACGAASRRVPLRPDDRRAAERGHAGGVVRRAPAGDAGRGGDDAGQTQRPAQRPRRGRGAGEQRRAERRPRHPLDVADVLHARAVRAPRPRQHLALDQRRGQRVVVRLDERLAAEAEIDGRRAALAVVERLGALEARRDPRRCSRSDAARAAGAAAAASGACLRTSRRRRQ